MTKKSQIIIAGICGLTAVAFGAFGAHTLKSVIDSATLETFKTGVLYHLIHSTVLFVLALSKIQSFTKAYIFIFIGIILFSFSLYLYSLTLIIAFIFVTPFGGMSFIIGWLLIIYSAAKEL